MQRSNRDFQDVLDEAARLHGHLCEGLVLGVRMAIAGLDELGIKDPKSREGKDLVIFVEIDRCPVDGIIAVTGRTPGKRSIKMMDYGKIAATFVDARCGRGVRVSARGIMSNYWPQSQRSACTVWTTGRRSWLRLRPWLGVTFSIFNQ